MTTPIAEAMAWPMAYPIGMAGCYVTERYGTERKSHQDPVINPSVPDRSRPVDNQVIDRRADRWMVADEQFALFLEALSTHAGRLTRLARERFVPTAATVRERAFDEETDRWLTFLRGQVAA